MCGQKKTKCKYNENYNDHQTSLKGLDYVFKTLLTTPHSIWKGLYTRSRNQHLHHWTLTSHEYRVFSLRLSTRKMHMKHVPKFYLNVTTNFPKAWGDNNHEISCPILGIFNPTDNVGKVDRIWNSLHCDSQRLPFSFFIERLRESVSKRTPHPSNTKTWPLIGMLHIHLN